MKRKIKIPHEAPVNKIKEFNGEDGNPFLIIVCQNGYLLTCNDETSTYLSEYQFDVGNIIDIEKTKNKDEFALSTS